MKRLIFFLFVLSTALTGVQRLDASCSAPANPIEAENCKTGSQNWNIDEGNDDLLAGYATDISFNKGETVEFKIDSKVGPFRMDLYRLGWYQGRGARLITSFNLPGTSQPACLFEPKTKLMDCGNWSVSASWKIPDDAVSGMYIGTLRGNGAVNMLIFIVRDDARPSELLFRTVDTTWQAYNHYKGISIYVPFRSRAVKVSYNRPIILRGPKTCTPFDHEIALVRWLERNAYDVTYFTGVDVVRRGELIKNHKAMIVSGHDEYWSIEERINTTAARNAGIHMAFLTGNNLLWKTRWEPSIDGKNTPLKTMVCYKEHHERPGFDPADPPVWTGQWSLGPSTTTWPITDVGPGFPGNELTAQFPAVIPPPEQNDPMEVRAEDGKMRFWRNTSVANLTAGQKAVFPEMLGYEWDADFDNGYRNLATWWVSFTSAAVGVRHNLVQVKHRSGALIWGTGTMQWAWHLDDFHVGGTKLPNGRHLPPTRDIQQATVNMLADMGIQPASLQTDLVRASASTDVLPPKCTVLDWSPKDYVVGDTVTVRGVAVDQGGGRVGGVIVSFNGGNNWYRANGRDEWTLKRIVVQAGGVRCGAVDDSGNLSLRFPDPQQPSAGGPNPVPALAFLNPSSKRTGSATFSLFVHGSNFVRGAIVYWNGEARPTTYLSSTRVMAQISAADVASEQTALVTVINPSPGGGQAGPLQFIVSDIASTAGLVRVYPNPWNVSKNPPAFITFDNLAANSEVKIFTLSGHWVRTLQVTPAGNTTWDLKNDEGESVASGYYLYRAKDLDNKEVRDRFAIIR